MMKKLYWAAYVAIKNERKMSEIQKNRPTINETLFVKFILKEFLFCA
jgi:hypothetical protein